MVKVMKYLHSLMMPIAILAIVGRKTFMVDYPIIVNLFFVYLLAFLFIQIPYAIYFRYKYNQEAEFKNANKI